MLQPRFFHFSTQIWANVIWFVTVVLDPSCFDLVIKSGIVEKVGIILGESPDSVLKVYFFKRGERSIIRFLQFIIIIICRNCVKLWLELFQFIQFKKKILPLLIPSLHRIFFVLQVFLSRFLCLWVLFILLII
jgi:hypothetical protein